MSTSWRSTTPTVRAALIEWPASLPLAPHWAAHGKVQSSGPRATKRCAQTRRLNTRRETRRLLRGARPNNTQCPSTDGGSGTPSEDYWTSSSSPTPPLPVHRSFFPAGIELLRACVPTSQHHHPTDCIPLDHLALCALGVECLVTSCAAKTRDNSTVLRKRWGMRSWPRRLRSRR